MLSPTEPLMILFKMGFIVGLVLASPIILWQLWAFLSPALYEKEKKTLVPALFVGLLLFLGGGIAAFVFIVPQALRVLMNADPVGFASVDQQGSRVAVARGAVSDAPDGRRWLGVTAVEVAPRARRQGLGRLVMAGIAVWGRQRGATDVYVQVAEPNTEGMAVYERLGFTEHHRYHYRRRPPRS